MTAIPDDVLRQFEALTTSTICDAYIRSGIRPVERMVVDGLNPILPRDVRAVGRARTQRRAQVRDRERLAMRTKPELTANFLEGAGPGDFLVVAASNGPPYAVFGGKMALIAKRQGVSGVLVDGATRDVPEILDHGLPTWVRGITPLPGGYVGYTAVETDCVVNCGGVEIFPGDVIVADGDGVVVVAAGDVARLLPVCLEMQAAEDAGSRAMKGGVSLRDAYPSRSYYWKDADKA